MSRRFTFLTLLVAVALLGSACSSDSSELDAANVRIADLEQELFTATSITVPTTRTITGTLSLARSDAHWLEIDHDVVCTSGKGGYDDIRPGAGVVVRDASGTVIGKSELLEGAAPDGESRCYFPFGVDVPTDVAFYEVEVSHRGGLTYSNAEMVAQDWTVAFVLS
jgi:hypothetical protein